MDVGGRRLDLGAMIFGAILLLVGVWYLLRNTFGFEMPEIDWDTVWPLIVIAIGFSVVARAMRRSGTTRD